MGWGVTPRSWGSDAFEEGFFLLDFTVLDKGETIDLFTLIQAAVFIDYREVENISHH